MTPTAIPRPTNTPLQSPKLDPLPSSGEKIIINRGRQDITGTATPGEVVIALINDIQAASAIVDANGRWRLIIPALAAGMHQLQLVTKDSTGNQSDISPSIPLWVVDSALHDFTGTGKTSIATWRRVGSNLHFKVRSPDESRWKSHKIKGYYPALGDYDGDGITDVAGVSVQGNRLIWSIHRSGTDTLVTVPFGKRGEKILTGCKLRSSGKHSLVTFAQKSRRIRAVELDEQARETGSLSSITHGDLIGCGDVTGDDVDELIFKIPGHDQKAATIVALDGDGRERLRKPLARFVRGYVVRRPGTEAPLLAVLNPTSRRGIPIRVETVAGTFAFPIFYVAPGSTISTGLFGQDISDQRPGVYWIEPRSNRIFYRIFAPDSPVVSLFKAPRGYRIFRPNSVFNTNR